MRGIKKIATISVGLTVFVAVGIAPAHANFVTHVSTYCDYGRVCLADSAAHDWGAETGPRMTSAIEWTLYGSYDTTALSISGPKSHSTTVDVWYKFDADTALPANVYGQYTCQAWQGLVCDHSHILLNSDEIASWSDDWLQRLACHETGHSVGLTHPNVDPDGDPNLSISENYRCMSLGFPGPNLLGPHNVSHINAYYG